MTVLEELEEWPESYRDRRWVSHGLVAAAGAGAGEPISPDYTGINVGGRM